MQGLLFILPWKPKDSLFNKLKVWRIFAAGQTCHTMQSCGSGGNSKPTFNINPIEEIKKLHEEKIALYERMLKEKDEMMSRLEKLLEK